MKLIITISVLMNFLYITKVYSFHFQPIIGFEKVHKSYPVEHTKTRFIYGARLLAGPQLLSVEAELTTGQDSESFPDRNLTVKEKVYNGMLGLRSGVDILLLNLYVRAGGHIRKSEVEINNNGVVTQEKPSAHVSPYAGAGLYLGPDSIKLHAGVTAIFTGRPNSGDVEYQYTIGASIGF